MHIDARMITLKFKSSQVILVPSCGFLLNSEEDSPFCPWCLAPHRIPSAHLSQLPCALWPHSLYSRNASHCVTSQNPKLSPQFPTSYLVALEVQISPLLRDSSWPSNSRDSLFIKILSPCGLSVLSQCLLLGGCLSSVCSLKDVSFSSI